MCDHVKKTELLAEYEDTRLGLPVVLVSSVTETSCEKCGKRLSIIIPDLQGLIAAMATTRITKPRKLSGSDIRFLRKALTLTGKELAGHLDVAPETVSRWENDREPIGTKNERLLRMLVGYEMTEDAPAIDFDPKEIWSMSIEPVLGDQQPEPMCFERVRFKRPQKPKENQWDEYLAEAA